MMSVFWALIKSAPGDAWHTFAPPCLFWSHPNRACTLLRPARVHIQYRITTSTRDNDP